MRRAAQTWVRPGGEGRADLRLADAALGADGLGEGADAELLEHRADLAGGVAGGDAAVLALELLDAGDVAAVAVGFGAGLLHAVLEGAQVADHVGELVEAGVGDPARGGAGDRGGRGRRAPSRRGRR